MKGYPARFEKDEDGRYCVFFLGKGMEGCLTYGNSLDDAKKNAQDALDAYIGYLYSVKKSIPSPMEAGEDALYFVPNYKVMFAVTLRNARIGKKLTQDDMAKRMGMLPAQYQRLENPRKTNPTLETIHKIEAALDEQVFLRI